MIFKNLKINGKLTMHMILFGDGETLYNIIFGILALYKRMKDIKIGLLDYGVRERTNLTNTDIMRNIAYEATIAEKYGFSRLWYTEHYINTIGSSWLSPEFILPYVACFTDHIRLGVAGVLSLYKNPFLVASNYKFLNNLYNNRIDLGFAKGTIQGGYKELFDFSELDNPAQRREKTMEKIESTIDFLRNEIKNHEHGILIPPFGGKIPEMWNLISSPTGYDDSLRLGINCSRTLFLDNANLSNALDDLKIYREKFYFQFGKQPQVNIVVTGTCQKTRPKCERVLSHLRSNNDYHHFSGSLFLTPEEIHEVIYQLATTYDVNEVIFLESSREFESRLDSIKNISRIFKLRDNRSSNISY